MALFLFTKRTKAKLSSELLLYVDGREKSDE